MEKRPLNVPLIVLTALGAVVLILAALFVYFSVNGKDYSNIYSQKEASGEIQNPSANFALASENDTQNYSRTIKVNTPDGEKTIIIKGSLSNLSSDYNITEEDVQKDLINYMGIYLELYNLHEIPFTSITPKVQVYLEGKPYFMEVSKGDIILSDGVAKNPDIVITTTYEEIFKMINNENYVTQSISLNRTTIELKANYFVLFSKGYLTLYNKLKGSFTGYVIR